MAFVFDATPGGASANSWATAAEGDDYFGGRRNASAWTSLATPGEKEIALADATLDLERLNFAGARASTTQRLRVPRHGLFDQDGFALASNVVPRPFKEALFEHTLFKLNKGTSDPLQPTGLEQFSSLSVPGAISITLRDSVTPVQFGSAAITILAPFLVAAPGQTRLVRT